MCVCVCVCSVLCVVSVDVGADVSDVSAHLLSYSIGLAPFVPLT